MNVRSDRLVAKLFTLLASLVLVAFVSGAGAAVASPIQEGQLLDSGFKILVATTPVQQDFVQKLPKGKIRAVQRTGKKFFIYPDAPRQQIYVGGPKEYEAYVKLHPEHRVADANQTARANDAYRKKQNDVMLESTARDLSDPFLGATWADLGW